MMLYRMLTMVDLHTEGEPKSGVFQVVVFCLSSEHLPPKPTTIIQ